MTADPAALPAAGNVAIGKSGGTSTTPGAGSAGAGVATLPAAGSAAGSAVTVEPPHVEEPKLPDQIKLVFDTTPSGAEVWFNGKRVSKTPYVVHAPGEKGTREYTFRMRGYDDDALTVSLAHDGVYTEALQKATGGTTTVVHHNVDTHAGSGSAATTATTTTTTNTAITHPETGSAGSATATTTTTTTTTPPKPPTDDCDDPPCLKTNINGLNGGH